VDKLEAVVRGERIKMATTRKRYSGEFKAKVALEAIKGQRTTNEIGATYGVHPVQVATWKRQVLEALPGALSDRRAHVQREEEQERGRLYEQIGKLQMELEWLKKRG
jgi:putative transposase